VTVAFLRRVQIFLLTYLLTWVTVDTEAGMTAHSQRWGPATKARPNAHKPRSICLMSVS